MAKFIFTDNSYIPLTMDKEVVLKASDAIESLVKWQYCDCGCPKQRSPANTEDAELLRIAAFLRINLIDD